MDESVLVLMSIAMFLGSYVAGFLPLYFTLSERRIRLASIFGAGLLVGTALSVIIPEGVSTLYKSTPVIASIPFKAAAVDPTAQKQPPLDFNMMLLNKHQQQQLTYGTIKQENQQKDKANEKSDDNHNIQKGEDQLNKDMAKEENDRRVRIKRDTPIAAATHSEQKHTAAEHLDEYSFSWAIGISLTTGFLFMFIVDQISKSSNISGGGALLQSTVLRARSVPTLGLVIHAAADGIAMGSASASSELELQLLVFLAIMLHKGPTAFALVSFLMLEGLERSRIRKHLLIFSAAAPIAAIITYTLLQNMNAKALGSPYVTGEILLFSGGTFLFIAVGHVLPELDSRSHFSTAEMVLFGVSALFPAFISSHSHGHGH